MSSTSITNTSSPPRQPTNKNNIFSLNYQNPTVDDLAKYEKEISSQLETIKSCTDENVLINIATDKHQDIRVRLAASEKVTTQSMLDYLLLATTLTPSYDNFKVALSIAQRTTNTEIVNCAMQSILSNAFIPALHDLVKVAISYTTSISILEKFINYTKTSPRLIDLAYERAMKLMEMEE